MTRTPSYRGLLPSSPRASAAVRGASKKADTKPELLLRRALWKKGCRYRRNERELPGAPDIVFRGRRVVIFCDGDFWHGKDWATRRKRLLKGTNADYWVAKIERNIERDREQTACLEREGWRVLRFWESEVLREGERVVASVIDALRPAGGPCGE